MSSRIEMAEKKAQAYRLYMGGLSQKDIATSCGITENTVSKWVNAESWRDRLNEEKTSSIELANSLMFAAKKITEAIIAEIGKSNYNIDAVTRLSDNTVKMMAAAERVANTVNKATVMDVFTAFDQWLLKRSDTDKDITPELLAVINRLHQEYLTYIQNRK